MPLALGLDLETVHVSPTAPLALLFIQMYTIRLCDIYSAGERMMRQMKCRLQPVAGWYLLIEEQVRKVKLRVHPTADAPGL
jgi:hypothetical protein